MNLDLDLYAYFALSLFFFVAGLLVYAQQAKRTNDPPDRSAATTVFFCVMGCALLWPITAIVAVLFGLVELYQRAVSAYVKITNRQ